MAAKEIEAFMNDFDDDGFVDACGQLEERAGIECFLTSHELQGDRMSCVTGQARGDDSAHGSPTGDSSSTVRVTFNTDGRDQSVEPLSVDAPPSELATLSNNGSSSVTENMVAGNGNSSGHQYDSVITPECLERSSSPAPAAEGLLNLSENDNSSLEDTESEVDGSRSRKKRPKRRKSESSDKEEEDVVARYMRKSDQKYAFNKADPNHPPLLTLRHGHLAASDFAALLWCEQQYVYKRTIPARVRREKLPEPEYVAAGTVLHKERELAIQKYVPVKTTSAEDTFAVEYSNTLLFMRRLLRQERPVVREVRIMAEIDGVLICGIIDELRVADLHDFAIDLVEFKTRNSKTVPRKAQKESHDLQVMLYKYMFDDMIRGRCLDDHLAQFGLDIDTPLGEAVAASIQAHCTSHGGAPYSQGERWTVRRLFEELRLVMQALPFIRSCLVNYTFQGDGDTFHQCEVAYDEAWLLNKLSHGLSFWRGKRGSEGVDVEEAWKCRLCPYQEHCWWVRHKSDQLQRQNQQRHGLAPSGGQADKQLPEDGDTRGSERTSSSDALSNTSST